MIVLLDGVAAVLLLVLVYRDFRFRTIPVIAVVLLLLVFIIRSVLSQGWGATGSNFAWNATFISLQLAVLYLYFLIRHRGNLKFTDNFLGLGDIALFLVICTLFSPINLLFFYLTGSFLTLILTIANKIIFRKNASETVPLAGWFSLYLLLLFLVNYSIFPVTFENDELIAGMLQPWMETNR